MTQTDAGVLRRRRIHHGSPTCPPDKSSFPRTYSPIRYSGPRSFFASRTINQTICASSLSGCDVSESDDRYPTYDSTPETDDNDNRREFGFPQALRRSQVFERSPPAESMHRSVAVYETILHFRVDNNVSLLADRVATTRRDKLHHLRRVRYGTLPKDHARRRRDHIEPGVPGVRECRSTRGTDRLDPTGARRGRFAGVDRVVDPCIVFSCVHRAFDWRDDDRRDEEIVIIATYITHTRVISRRRKTPRRRSLEALE